MAGSTQPLVPNYHGHRFFRAKSLSRRSLHGAIFVPCDTLNCCVFAGGCAAPGGNQTAGRSRTREQAANRKNTSCLLITRRADRAARPAGADAAHAAENVPRHPHARIHLNPPRKRASSKKSWDFSGASRRRRPGRPRPRGPRAGAPSAARRGAPRAVRSAAPNGSRGATARPE